MKAVILLVSSQSTIVLLGADQQYKKKYRTYYLQGNFIRVFCLNVPSVTFPATIMYETSVVRTTIIEGIPCECILWFHVY